MHDLPPPKNVILSPSSASASYVQRRCKPNTHKFEYTPGIFAFVTLSGIGSSQRSGRHSSASAPQIALLRFAESMPMPIAVSFGTTIESSVRPLRPRMGDERGRTISFRVL